MNRNVQNNESSLLLQLPKSVLSFSDMSGNSFLMPVAVENAADAQKSIPENSNQETHTKVGESSVCQLQQPLLMRRETSPAPNSSVPYLEPIVQTNNESFQREVSDSRPPVLPVASGARSTNRSIHTLRRSSSPGLPVQSSSMSSNFLNRPPTMYPEGNPPTLSNPVNKENISMGHQNIYPPPESSVPSSSNYPMSSGMPQVYPGYSEQSNEYRSVSSTFDYYSQPPVITPSTIPSYYKNSGGNLTQSSVPNVNYEQSWPNEAYHYVYEPVKPYWLFKDIVEKKEIWCGFSKKDSEELEIAFQQDPQKDVVHVDGGRYDAILSLRIKKPVYYEGENLQIRRSTWFYLHDTARFVPFPEESSTLIEEFYEKCCTSRQWQKRIDLPGLGSIVFDSPDIILFYKNEVEVWTPLPTLPDAKASPKTVKRGLPETFDIMASEEAPIDHLVFIVQGIGSFCDLRFRTVSECVDGVRDLSYKLLSSHFRHEVETKQVGRVEFLPIAWHAKLHTSEKGFDCTIKNITLPSIPKLRHFTNDTLLDILLYSSPFYCQSIIDTVSSDLNRVYELFTKRNPGFSGKVFVAGHSLGSLILFDILSHQNLANSSSDNVNNEDNPESEKQTVAGTVVDSYDSIVSLLQACELNEFKDIFEEKKIDLCSVIHLSNDNLKDLGLSADQCNKLLNAIHANSKVADDHDEYLSSTPSTDKTIQRKELDQTISETESIIFPLVTSPCMASIRYPSLHFEPSCLFALGSPISMFLSVRGYDFISDEFRFPTCPGFFNIFHPYDPVAYRIEPLIDPNFSVKPVLIPHHKGRKRMHLEIRENLSKVGFEIKQRVLETLRSTWNSLSGFAKSHNFQSAAVEAEVDKLVNEQISAAEYEQTAPSEICCEELQIGALNGGHRIDYVLQEKPIEALNDYIFALTSHATYWNSEDTVLMILREIYATQGIMVSSQSILDQKEISAGHSSYEAYTQINPMTSSPYLHRSSSVTQGPGVSPFYSQSVSLAMTITSQNIQPLCHYSTASVPQNSSNVPGPSYSMQSLSQYTSSSIPQTSANISGPSQNLNMQPLSHYSSTSAPQISSNMPGPSHNMQSLSEYTSASAPQVSCNVPQQPVGPPPLTGFVKRSPFVRNSTE